MPDVAGGALGAVVQPARDDDPAAVDGLDPSTVVLGGDIANAHEQLLAHVRGVVYTRSLPLESVASQLGDRAGILGGAYLAIEHRLRPEALDRRLGSGELAAWA